MDMPTFAIKVKEADIGQTQVLQNGSETGFEAKRGHLHTLSDKIGAVKDINAPLLSA